MSSTIDRFIRKAIREMRPYAHARQDVPSATRLHANENPFIPCDAIRKCAAPLPAQEWCVYPSENAKPVRVAAGIFYGMPSDMVYVDNGSSSALHNLFNTCVEEGDLVVTTDPTFELYRTLTEQRGATLESVRLTTYPDEALSALAGMKGKMAIVANPHAPTGVVFSEGAIIDLVERFDGLVVIDEAYADFTGVTYVPLVRTYENLVVVRTLSKSESLAGARIGFLFAHPDIVAYIDRARPTYNVSALTQMVAIEALTNRSEVRFNIHEIVKLREDIATKLQACHFRVVPSQANFLYVSPPEGTGTAHDWERWLRSQGILVRTFSSSEFLRISIGSSAEMDQLMDCVLARVAQR